MNDYKIDSKDVLYKIEELLSTQNSRYKITVQVAHRAKRRKYEDIDIVDDPLIKPVIRAIVEMVDEITQPEIIID
nr:RpoZ [Erythrocladia irregularis]